MQKELKTLNKNSSTLDYKGKYTLMKLRFGVIYYSLLYNLMFRIVKSLKAGGSYVVSNRLGYIM